MAAIRRLKSGRWSAEVRLPNGRRTTRTDTSKTFVKQWATDLETQIRRGEWVDPNHATPVGPAPTLGQWRDTWLATRHRGMNTASREDNDWKMRVSYFQDQRLDQITALDVQEWSARMSREHVGPTSHKQAIETLRQLYTAAIRHGITPSDPTKGLKKPTVPKHVDRILTRDEAARLDRASGGDPMIRLMLWCGLRWGEAAGMTGARIDLDRRQLHVRQVMLKDGTVKDCPKSAAGNRTVPLPDLTIQALTPVMRPGLLFHNQRGLNWKYRGWSRAFTKYVTQAGLADPQPTGHDLRHTYGSWLADAGMPIHDIAALMGHSETRSTQRYVHSGLGRMRSALDALGG